MIRVPHDDEAIFYSQGWSSSYGPGWGDAVTPDRRPYPGTAHASDVAGAYFSYSHPDCRAIRWYGSVGAERGLADVYVDGALVAAVDVASTGERDEALVHDTGPLEPGAHTLRVIVRGEFGTGSGRRPWLELERLEVDGEPGSLGRVNDDNVSLIRYGGEWRTRTGRGFLGGECHESASAASWTEFLFAGRSVRWAGARSAAGGDVDVIIDGATVATVSTRSEQAADSAVLFAADDVGDGFHKLTICPRTSGATFTVDYFECASFIANEVAERARRELTIIRDGSKPYLRPDEWAPVPYRAEMPGTGVRLTPVDGRAGPLLTAFGNNLAYIRYRWSLTAWVERETFWTERWPAAIEAQLLRGAGHALRWVDEPDLREIVDSVVALSGARQERNGDGFALPWPEAEMPDRGTLQRANYDRAMWTNGMRAAILAGHRDAPKIMRAFYDWFDSWVEQRMADPTHPEALVEMFIGVQGHLGSTVAYFSGVGVPRDIVDAERYYVQDYWVDLLTQRQPAAIWRYPLDRPHSYLLTGGEALLDHYRASGAAKFLDAARGMWDIFRDYFMFPGGGTGIAEYNTYPPGSLLLSVKNSETCASVFWIYLNARFLQLYPDEEVFASEIEKSLYNVCLAAQELSGQHRVRYHMNLCGVKEEGRGIGTCCEGQATSLFSELPQYLYSVAPDGVYVNLYESSQIGFRVATAGCDVRMSTTSRFPYRTNVEHALALDAPARFTVRVRVPSWAAEAMPVCVNGHVAGAGKPGSYIAVDREWRDGDTITYRLPAAWNLQLYTGQDQVPGAARYGLCYGPVLYALLGPELPKVIDVSPDDLVAGLQFTADGVLDASHPLLPGATFRPYWLVHDEEFTCFPAIRP